MSHAVFISHASVDREVAEAACKALEGAGIECWIAPRNITPGQVFGEAIDEAIESSALLLLILTQGANDSDHVYLEVERATHFGIPRLVLRTESITPSRKLALFCSAHQWLDVMDLEPEEATRRLVAATKTLLDRLGGKRDTTIRMVRDAGPNLDSPRQNRFQLSLKTRWFTFVVTLGIIGVIVGTGWLTREREEDWSRWLVFGEFIDSPTGVVGCMRDPRTADVGSISDSLESAREEYRQAEARLANGRYSEAETLLRQALATFEAHAGNRHPDTATMAESLCSVLAVQGKADEALPLCEKALRIDEAAYGERSVFVARDLNALAGTLARAGRYREAEEHLRRSLAICREPGLPEGTELSVAMGTLGAVLFKQRRYEEALALHREALAVGERVRPRDPETALERLNVGTTLWMLGQREAARDEILRGLRDLEASGLQDHPYAVQAREQLREFDVQQSGDR